ncbi:MAG: hypothetical protein RLZZ187_1247 [Pseudomonadota bacterium]|jgi:hypothetical protein
MEFVHNHTDTASFENAHGNQSLSVLPSTSNVEVIDNKTMDFIKRYQVYAYRTAEAFIKLAVTYAEAKRELDCVQFQTFANAIGVDPESATSTRLLKIAANHGRFLPYLAQLPSAYTTLYELARIDASRFEDLVRGGVIKPTMTGGDLQVALAKHKDGSNLNVRQANNAHIAFERLEPADRLRLWSRLSQAAKEFNIRIDLESNLQKQLALITTEKGQANA